MILQALPSNMILIRLKHGKINFLTKSLRASCPEVVRSYFLLQFYEVVAGPLFILGTSCGISLLFQKKRLEFSNKKYLK